MLAIVALLAALAVAACSSADGGSVTTSGDVASVDVEAQQIFAANCAVCHGANGQGQPDWHIPNDDGILPAPPLNGDGHTWHHPDGFLYRIVSQGGKIQEGPSIPDFKSGMPAFGGVLSHQEIIDVLTYVKSLWGDKTRLGGQSIRQSQAFVSERDPFPASGN